MKKSHKIADTWKKLKLWHVVFFPMYIYLCTKISIIFIYVAWSKCMDWVDNCMVDIDTCKYHLLVFHRNLRYSVQEFIVHKISDVTQGKDLIKRLHTDRTCRACITVALNVEREKVWITKSIHKFTLYP